jgi:hypothetical protein
MKHFYEINAKFTCTEQLSCWLYKQLFSKLRLIFTYFYFYKLKYTKTRQACVMANILDVSYFREKTFSNLGMLRTISGTWFLLYFSVISRYIFTLNFEIRYVSLRPGSHLLTIMSLLYHSNMSLCKLQTVQMFVSLTVMTMTADFCPRILTDHKKEQCHDKEIFSNFGTNTITCSTARFFFPRDNTKVYHTSLIRPTPLSFTYGKLSLIFCVCFSVSRRKQRPALNITKILEKASVKEKDRTNLKNKDRQKRRGNKK